MGFALTGVTNKCNQRRFTFELAGGATTRTTIVVVADLALARKYEIPLQELPLLCLRLIESQMTSGTLVFAEKEMVEYADRRQAAKDLAEQKRRAHRVPKPNPRDDA